MADGRSLAREVAERQIAMFAMFAGPGRTVTRAALSAASGVPESSLREYAAGAAMPLHVALALRPHLPGAAMDMLTEPGGARLVDAERSQANWDLVASGAAGLAADICRARAGGAIDHVASARLRIEVRELAAEFTNLAEDT